MTNTQGYLTPPTQNQRTIEKLKELLESVRG
jgi:hypothetical protein